MAPSFAGLARQEVVNRPTEEVARVAVEASQGRDQQVLYSLDGMAKVKVKAKASDRP